MYSIIAYIAQLLLPVAALFSRKMSLFVKGRKGMLERMKQSISPDDRVIWFHASSMGEFEEIRPLVEKVRAEHGCYKILVTFFSPSGYEPMKGWKGADWVFCLPVDTPRNARRFIAAAHPEIAVFSITDYWFNHLREMHRYGTKAYVVSARFVKDNPVFKWYGFAYRKIIRDVFTNILTKDEQSVGHLQAIGFNGGIRCGDPRFDRVIDIASEPWRDEIVERFKGRNRLFAAASTVTSEDDDLAICLANRYPDVKFMFVPHEMDEAPMQRIIDMTAGKAIKYSQCGTDTDFSDIQILIVDCVGKLARLYRYAEWALVGGGFYKGLHSVIEASVYGIPVVTGPILYNNKPAAELASMGINGVVRNNDQIIAWFDPLYRDESARLALGRRAYEYCYANKGASSAIVDIILS